MYIYDDYDKQLIAERTTQYREQTRRYFAGELSEAEFLPLRLQNGLYVQRLAPMLRVAVPYGMISSKQLRKMAEITRKYDKGYAHISTRQNIQLNWPKLEQVPDILEELASVEMHAIQTSGNCIRSTTSDQFAGVAPDENIDPRPYCEIIRQWSSFHPEFAFLPRKFKIAVCGSDEDRAAIAVHDVGLELVKNDKDETGFKVFVGGGLGRTPIIGNLVYDFVAESDILIYLDAILRVYNQHGRRDNKYKARIKILVKAMGVEAFRAKVDDVIATTPATGSTLTDKEINRVKAFFTEPAYEQVDALAAQTELNAQKDGNAEFAHWLNNNVTAHKKAGYAIVNLSLKKTGIPPGDLTDKQLEAIADLADQYSFGEARTTHNQNAVLADVKQSDLFVLWEALKENGFATPNIGKLTDMICCPGGDYCALANAKSIPVADEIAMTFDNLDYLYDLGEIRLNISGCMNSCGHHHVGHIGILGVDKKGEEFYQVCLGGSSKKDASLGKILGPSFSRDQVTGALEKLLQTYVEKRTDEESFLDTYRRIGIKPFKEKVYA